MWPQSRVTLHAQYIRGFILPGFSCILPGFSFGVSSCPGFQASCPGFHASCPGGVSCILPGVSCCPGFHASCPGFHPGFHPRFHLNLVLYRDVGRVARDSEKLAISQAEPDQPAVTTRPSTSSGMDHFWGFTQHHQEDGRSEGHACTIRRTVGVRVTHAPSGR